MRHVGARLDCALEPRELDAERRTLLGDARRFVAPAGFADHLARRRDEGRALDYVAICTPNHLHAEHTALALRAGSDAVCEKPVALDLEQIDELCALERETGRRVHAMLQLRHHPALRALRARRAGQVTGSAHVELDYRVDGQRWRDRWHGDEVRSGGIAFELGIHSLDLLLWIFGRAREWRVQRNEPDRLEARLELQRASVRWRLDSRPLGPGSPCGPRRTLTVDGDRIDLARDCHGLHRHAYAAILAGRGPGLRAARPAIELADRLRRGAPVLAGESS